MIKPGPGTPHTAHASRPGPMRVSKTPGVTLSSEARPITGKRRSSSHGRPARNMHIVCGCASLRGTSCHRETAQTRGETSVHNEGPSCHQPRAILHVVPPNIDNELGNSGPSCHKQGTHRQGDPGPTWMPSGNDRPERSRGARRAQSPATEAYTVPRRNERPVNMRNVFRLALPAQSIK